MTHGWIMFRDRSPEFHSLASILGNRSKGRSDTAILIVDGFIEGDDLAPFGNISGREFKNRFLISGDFDGGVTLHIGLNRHIFRCRLTRLHYAVWEQIENF